ncbi:hypothetical protein K438DRAFT_1852768, partial [Mycena galopus ATCC 62051]
MENIHHILYAVVKLHIKSETVGSLPPLLVDNIEKFVKHFTRFTHLLKHNSRETRSHTN